MTFAWSKGTFCIAVTERWIGIARQQERVVCKFLSPLIKNSPFSHFKLSFAQIIYSVVNARLPKISNMQSCDIYLMLVALTNLLANSGKMLSNAKDNIHAREDYFFLLFFYIYKGHEMD